MSALDNPYEASDEASETEFERSLSVWRGWGCLDNEQFDPIPLDLHTASSIGQYDCVRAIIKHQIEDLNRPNIGGWTALMYAAYIGHDNIVNLLLEAGVSVHGRNKKGQTPLMLASSCGNESVAYFLLQAGAQLEARDSKGWTALFHATYSGHQNMVKFLLDNDANADAVSLEVSREYTPLMEAASAGHEIIVQYFLQHGVNVNARTCAGDTAKGLALMHGHTKIVSLIDNHSVGHHHPLRAEAGLSFDGDLSSSDEALQSPRRSRGKPRKGPSIQEGPEAFDRLYGQKKSTARPQQSANARVSRGSRSFAKEETSHTSAAAKAATTAIELRYRDVTSPIHPDDHPLSSSGGKDSVEGEEDGNAFSRTGALTIKSSSSSSGGLIAALGLSRTNSAESSDEPTAHQGASPLKPAVSGTGLHRSLSDSGLLPVAPECPVQGYVGQGESRRYYRQISDDSAFAARSNQSSGDKYGSEQKLVEYSHFGTQGQQFPNLQELQVQIKKDRAVIGQTPPPMAVQSSPSQPIREQEAGSGSGKEVSTEKRGLSAKAKQEQRLMMSGRPMDLTALLHDLGLTKYLSTFAEQDVDLQVFLSLTDNDLKEVGIKLFGPRRKMTNAIARWHSNARPSGNDLEQAYADKLETEMQEMAIQLHQTCERMQAVQQQLSEERELRAVTEGCLMDERATWRQLTALAHDTRRRCTELHSTLHAVRIYASELARRLANTDSRSGLTGSSGRDSLAAALQERLLLDKSQTDSSELFWQSTGDIFNSLQQLCDELESNISMATHNSDKLLVHEAELSRPAKDFHKFQPS